MKKSVLITGCSEGGIGDALAQEFHRKGLRVFATARDLTKIEHLKAMSLEVLQLDVTSQESIRHAVEAVQKATGEKLDFLVNNAGAGTSLRLVL
jgi:1-acylglycerone phosphate reductase